LLQTGLPAMPYRLVATDHENLDLAGGTVHECGGRSWIPGAGLAERVPAQPLIARSDLPLVPHGGPGFRSVRGRYMFQRVIGGIERFCQTIRAGRGCCTARKRPIPRKGTGR
jgi:hypothetical protein